MPCPRTTEYDKQAQSAQQTNKMYLVCNLKWDNNNSTRGPREFETTSVTAKIKGPQTAERERKGGLGKKEIHMYTYTIEYEWNKS